MFEIASIAGFLTLCKKVLTGELHYDLQLKSCKGEEYGGCCIHIQPSNLQGCVSRR